MFKFICLFVCVTYVYADIPAGRNQYLPPEKGYNYDKPNVPFPSMTQPTQVPYPRPPTSPPYRPPTSPPYRPPTSPPYRPPTSPPYRPPTSPPYRPPTPSNPPPPHQPSYPPSGVPDHDHHHHHHHEPGMPFDFQYSVNDAQTANDYTHKAVSDGDVTRGEYRVQLPDGRTQIVRYTADWKNGYNAEVTYEGQARYPEGPFGQGGNQGYIY